MLTMSGTVLGGVLIYGLFGMGGEPGGAGFLLLHFIGGMACLFWTLFGLTALAHQLHMQITDQPVPDTREAAVFVWSRMQPLLLLPVYAAGGLLALLLGEMLLLVLAKIPGLGMLWLVLIGAPLLLLNTVIVIVLLLAVFNIAARVAISDADVDGLRDALWQLLRHRLPELLIYNLGGVVASLLVAVVLLSPLWLGAGVTSAVMDVVAGEQMLRIQEASGFWGGLAHLLSLLVFGVLLSAVAGVPGIVITHMTLLLHLEFEHAKDADGEGTGSAVPESDDSAHSGDSGVIEAQVEAEAKPTAKPKRKPRAKPKPKAEPEEKA
ncbi:MAG: hypothetical protein COW19_10645 [Zetaproteobacteria bacterium CG12_big_fil_rev_8_21_14_0_65_55_1124]|nr:MAG: hypothetical protein AUJ58_00010 [Zetaproteobacteria bacterium CG1_02_55_237]PIS19082.1 MAG: hypothetical protein COT53_07590 [Zetaproteobacteria bacterium CG08_land_8_20_14_0_20_55_17]PIW41945.1 MAG: hypothetical protein COW19_10645 [Zetaproteobacteria bacterium CG12_big_fil_rev_8_21_14_0_65_55_1124]PIY51411.1 MAG: hypothetical protein COZ01_11310 [Zetaproteobacteria bacterium CG_4_10_14_0_8_um_filter_55_43]PIZ36994.1 MAG: hypothetical protein COY36_10480 [Zetaproteobacteria bacterium 